MAEQTTPESVSRAPQIEERRAKALKLLEALCEPCENVKTDGDHVWRKCRACLAQHELDCPEGKELLRALLDSLSSPLTVPLCGPHGPMRVMTMTAYCATCGAEVVVPAPCGSHDRR